MTQSTKVTRSSLPSSGSQLITVAKYEFRNYFGSRRFYVLLAIALIVSALLTYVVAVRRPTSFLDNSLDFYSSWWGRIAGLMVILSGIFFGGDAISAEFQNRTGYFLVPNPVRRSSIYVGKWISAFLAAVIILAITLAITIANAFYYFGPTIPNQLVLSVAFSFIYLASVMGVTFMFSSLFKSSSYSILVSAILYLFVFSLVEELVSTIVQIEPWFIPTYGASIIANVMTVPFPAHVVTEAISKRISLTIYTATIPEGLEVLLGYCLISAILGLVLFEKKDFT
ncbi:MAG: ABC transporter permease [Conexivisphaerales archaeon]|jgi:ABC-2 type transport system permease protein